MDNNYNQYGNSGNNQYDNNSGQPNQYGNTGNQYNNTMNTQYNQPGQYDNIMGGQYNSCMEDQYNQYGNTNNNWNNQNNTQNFGVNEQITNRRKQKVKKPKRRKKHRFLKFLLLCLIAYAGYKGSSKILGNLAENEMKQFIVDYPFTFDCESDCLWYVTDNFSIPTSYSLGDKEYKVEWDSNNTMIRLDESGNATISRPDDCSVVVQLTETYKKLWGKATRQYELTLVPTSCISADDVNVIDLETLESGSYHRDMQAVSDADGNLKYMLGDFKDTYVNSAEDAQVILEVYKSQFTDEDIQFKFVDITNIGMYITYKFDVYKQSMKCADCSASVVLLSNTNKVTKISIDYKPVDQEVTNNTLELDSILESIPSILNSVDIECTSSDDFAVYSAHKELYNGSIIYSIELVTIDGWSYRLRINAVTGELIDCESLVSHADEESVTAKSTNELGEEISFDATLAKPGWLGFLEDEEYILKDQNRNIQAYYNEGWWGLFKEAQKALSIEDPNILEAVGSFFVGLAGLGDYYIEAMIKAKISSDTDTFEDGVSAQAYHNMQIVYDWYKDNLGIISFDGKGKAIVVRTNVKLVTDNAAWDNGTKTFMINPAGSLKYSVGLNLEVLGHEYTHAVFKYAGVNLSGGQEVSGLSEAYGDIMGTIIAQNDDWLICKTELTDGTPVVFRDLKNINGSNLYMSMKYPETYHGENWSGEEHNICSMIGHIAYEMKEHGGFSWDDMADIWYNSLGLTYDNSSTFVTCRKYIIQTADDLGYSDEQIDFIANAFDGREIFDESYEFRTDKYTNKEEETSDGSETTKTEKIAKAGDPLLDDSTQHRFLIAYSVLQMIFNGDGIYIYEEANTMSKDEQEQFEELLNKKVQEMYDLESLSGNEIKVMYRQIPGWQIDFLDKFCGDTMTYIKGRTYEIMDDEGTDEDTEVIKGWFNKLLRYAFDWEITNSTAYDFYDKLGLIE